MKILNYGSLNYDFVYSLDHFVQAGETITSSQMERFLGGKGLNQSIALARAGADVFHAGMIGQDGELFLQALKENGINCDHIHQVDGPSGHAIIQLNKNGENSIILFEGANGKNNAQYITETFQQFEKDDILLIQNEINELDQVVSAAVEKQMKIVLNPSPFNHKLNHILDKVWLFIMNEVEGYQITNKKDPNDILKVMSEKYPNAKVMLTLGSKGCVYKDKSVTASCESYHVNVVDTTAAGDTFTGYFISSFTSGQKVEDAMEEATAAAALAITKKGAVNSIPRINDVKSAEFRRRK